MKSLLHALPALAALAITTLIACNPPASPQNPANTGSSAVAEMTDAEISALAKSYTSLPALNTELKKSPTHEGMMVRTHLDQAAMTAFTNKSFPLPDGSVSVKEGHKTAEGPVEMLFVMKKIKGYDSANGDWFYAMVAPDGTAKGKGKIQMCISCHSTAKNKDYIYGFNP